MRQRIGDKIGREEGVLSQARSIHEEKSYEIHRRMPLQSSPVRGRGGSLASDNLQLLALLEEGIHAGIRPRGAIRAALR